jgi:hypothetical protein
MMTFQRQSIKERGHFSNLPTMFPVLRMTIDSKGISIKRRFLAQVYYKWSSINVEVIKRKSFKGYGGFAGANFIQNICSIYANGKRYSFDISADFPDFNHKDTKNIMEEISRNCKINEISRLQRNWKDWWTKFDHF